MADLVIYDDINDDDNPRNKNVQHDDMLDAMQWAMADGIAARFLPPREDNIAARMIHDGFVQPDRPAYQDQVQRLRQQFRHGYEMWPVPDRPGHINVRIGGVDLANAAANQLDAYMRRIGVGMGGVGDALNAAERRMAKGIQYEWLYGGKPSSISTYGTDPNDLTVAHGGCRCGGKIMFVKSLAAHWCTDCDSASSKRNCPYCVAMRKSEAALLTPRPVEANTHANRRLANLALQSEQSDHTKLKMIEFYKAHHNPPKP